MSTARRALIRVLLADGNRRAPERLAALADWETLGFHPPVAATGAEEVLAAAQTLLPELLIVSADLPCGNVPGLVERLRRGFPQSEVLLVSTKPDFECAKQAIRLGIFEYLLWEELTAQVLVELLKRLRRKIRGRDDAAEIRRRSRLEQYLCCPASTEKQALLREELESLHARQWGLILAGEPERVGSYAPWHWEEPAPAAIHIRQQICAEEFCAAVFHEFACRLIAIPCQGTRALVLVCFENRPTGESKRLQTMERLSEMIRERCRVSEGRRPTVLCHGAACEGLEDIYAGYRKLVEQYPRMVFPGGSPAAPGRGGEEIWTPARLPEEFDGQTLERWSRQVCADFQARGTGLASLRTLLSAMDDTLERCARRGLLPAGQAGVMRQELADCTGTSALVSLFQAQLHELCRSPEAACSERVRRAVRFIRENYMLDIGVQDAARQLGLNAEYLNKLFKREMGQGFAHYLACHRIRQAKTLLEEENCRVGEVAELVGYKSSQYFSVAFRQHMGVSPSAFARRA